MGLFGTRPIIETFGTLSGTARSYAPAVVPAPLPQSKCQNLTGSTGLETENVLQLPRTEPYSFLTVFSWPHISVERSPANPKGLANLLCCVGIAGIERLCHLYLLWGELLPPAAVSASCLYCCQACTACYLPKPSPPGRSPSPAGAHLTRPVAPGQAVAIATTEDGSNRGEGGTICFTGTG